MISRIALSRRLLWITLNTSLSFAAAGMCQDQDKKANASDVKRVVRHLRTLAENNAAKPAAERKVGDELTQFYIRGLAAYCVEEKIAAKDFLLSLGVGLDSSGFLRKYFLTQHTFKDFDDDGEFKLRQKSLGKPTLHKRGDWLQHFAVSASLAAALNAEVAESLGIAKEVQDSIGGSGFSFADLAADDAGIALSAKLLAHPHRFRDIAASFRPADFLLPTDDLEEGLTHKSLTGQYGGVESEKFKNACRDVKYRVFALPVYRSWSADAKPVGGNPK